jgi:Protein of unknown function (DUF998)
VKLGRSLPLAVPDWPSHLANARTVRRVLIPAAGAVFFAALIISAVPHYAGKPMDLMRAVISDLASPEDNPHGYLIAAAGMAVCGLLLVPAAHWFFRVLRRIHSGVAAAGLLLFGSALAGQIAMGLMAPFESAYSDVHIYIAYFTFLMMAAGILVWLAAAVPARRRVLAAAILQGCVVAFLIYLTAGLLFHTSAGDFFDNRDLFRSVAFCEWLLCVCNAAFLCLLAAATEFVEAAPLRSDLKSKVHGRTP